MITVYTLTFNEELLMKFMIDHYRSRFPGCRIVVYDNFSIDKTVEIALKNNCEIVPFDTNCMFSDRKNMEIKNTCWKDAITDWVLVCDLDELLDINLKQLKAEEALGTTIIKPEVYDMINMVNNTDIASIKYGVKSPVDGKISLFNKKYIQEINFGIGAHSCNPKGKAVFSQSFYKMYHYNAISENITIEKFKIRSARLSPDNIKNGWGLYLFMTPDEIRAEYAAERAKAVKVR